MKEKLLISACLLGEKCRYDGGGNYTPGVERLRGRCELVPVCPERLGGLPTPRTPAERAGEKVMSKTGTDVTEAFRTGAEKALETALAHGIHLALLKERSPSCGRGYIYDGSFSGKIISGDGVTAELLARNDIRIYGESHIGELLEEIGGFSSKEIKTGDF